MKMLIVADNPLIATAIERAGERLRMTPECVTDGWDAIERLEKEAYDAIVIDTDLPRQSGFGVLTYLREEVGERLDNVVVVTSSDREEMRRKIADSISVIAKSEEASEIEQALLVAWGREP